MGKYENLVGARNLWTTLFAPGALQRLAFRALSWRPLYLTWRALARLQRPQIYLGDSTLLTRTLFGQLMYLDTRDDSLTPYLAISGFWEPHVTRVFLDLLHPGARVVEVGANVGYYTLLAGVHVGAQGRVVAFEANPAVIPYLRRSVNANGISAWTTVVPMAASDRSGKVLLSVPRHFRGGSSILERATDGAGDLAGEVVDSVEVAAVSLDEYFQASEDTFDLLKMDAEGCEPLVLDGMHRVLAHSPRIKMIIEFAPAMVRRAGRDPRAYIESLRALGFALHLIEHNGRVRPISIDDLLTAHLVDLLLTR